MYDSETGFYYLRSRYYSPDIGRFINADAYTTTNQDFDGNNMFAYCGNNPVINVDYSGMRHVRGIDACGGGYSNVSVDENNNKKKIQTTGTYTLGQNLCLTLGIVSVEVQIMCSTDTQGNIALQWGYAGSFVSAGNFTVSSQTFETITTAPTVDYLEGEGYLIGATEAVPIPYSPISALFGYGVNIIPNKDHPNNAYIGITRSTGIAWPNTNEDGAWDVNISISNTETITKANLFE